jgi:hypothetical protein
MKSLLLALFAAALLLSAGACRHRECRSDYDYDDSRYRDCK